MNTLLLTGATGFIGRHCLTPLTERGYDIHAVTRGTGPTIDHEGVTWHTADLLEPTARQKLLADHHFTDLLHLAWYTTPGEYLSSRENIRWARASLDLLERFEAGGGQRAVMAGTCLEYDVRHGYLSEGVTPLNPRSLYATSKDAVRSIGHRFADDTELTMAWPRVFLLYGPHERRERLVPSVVTSILRGEQAVCTHGRQIRDFLHVQDVADALCRIVDSEVAGPINVASGQPTTVRDVVGEIAGQLERPDLVAFGARSPRPGEPRMILGDTSRLRDELGWTPERSLEEGLAETIEWWQTKLE